jgi:hypothetical protein
MVLLNRQSALAYLVTAGEKAKFIFEVNAKDPLDPAVALHEWDEEYEEKANIGRDALLKSFRKQLISTPGFTVLKQSKAKAIRQVAIRLKSKIPSKNPGETYISWKSNWPAMKSRFSLDDLVSVSKLHVEHNHSQGGATGSLDNSTSFVCVRLTNRSRQLDLLFESSADVDVYISFFETYIKPYS